MQSRAIRIQAPAKLHLRLRVLAPEPSGYHSIETLFCAISLSDQLEIEPASPGVHLEVSGGIETGPAEENLVVRAAHEFFDRAGIEPAVRIRLEKSIPAAAGLGGGSSDAAATLRALNRLHDEPLDGRILLELGLHLGSDVPFFLSRTPFALAWGRGERLLNLNPLSSAHILVAHPGPELATRDAYQRLAELRGEPYTPHPAVLSIEALGSWEEVREYAANDFEFIAFERIARLPHMIRMLLDEGASIALLSGSGPAFFGTFSDPESAQRARQKLQRTGLRTWAATPLQSWPEPVLRVDPDPALD
jgi:4-diphosphocytidyl-2-C-methyl-D-erythritol kinase